MVQDMSQTESSTFPLNESWTYKITVLANIIAKRVTPVAMEVGGLNLSQWRVIAAIADKPGRFASQVVDITPMDKGIVSRAVATLVQRGLIARRSSNNDGRSSHLFLTEEGQQTYTAVMRALEDIDLSGSALLPDHENSTFLATLDALITQVAGRDPQTQTSSVPSSAAC